MEGRVLIADDEQGIRDVLTWELGNAGYDVTAVSDGAAAVEQLRVTEYDVVISDIRMPGLSGLDVLRAVRELSPDTETIVMTAFAALETAIECVRGGAFDFVQKPFDVDYLSTTVSRALERRRLRSAASLYEASHAILSTDDPKKLPGVIVDVTMRIMAADDASLMLATGDDTLYVAESRGLSAEARAGVVAIGERVAGRVAASRQPVVIESSLASDTRFADVSSFNRVRSSIVYPLVSGGHLIGLLNINRVRNPRPYRNSDLERASVLASQILLALENRRLMQSIAVSERLAAIGQVAAGVAHEINNPLACVLANQAFMQDGLKELASWVGQAAADSGPAVPDLLEELLQALADAQKGAGHVRDIVRDVQALGRGNDALSEVDVNDAVRSALRVASPRLRRRAKVTTDLGCDTHVIASGGRLSQVFINLLVNAAQALEQKPETRGEIIVTSRREGDRVVVDVSDTGPGINPENRTRLFEPFFTTKGPDAGTGLGLPISRDIARRFGGELRVASVPGQGATFTVDLPAARPAAVGGADRAQQDGATRGAEGRSRLGRPRVLFIDDDEAILRAYQRAFGHDHEISFADSGAEALSSLGRPWEVDVIVCDLIMPGLSGMELYGRVRETQPELAGSFVFVTGAADRREVREFLAAVDNPVIEKPIDVGELRRAIAATAERQYEEVRE